MSDDIPEWAKKRACELANAVPSDFPAEWIPEQVDHALSRPLVALARYIAKHEPEPVDPLLVMAREAAALGAKARGYSEAYQKGLRAGVHDVSDECVTALTALRMAKEQGLPE